MNILNKAALQSLKKSRTRTLVTVIGVMLSAAMFTAVTTFGFSMLNYMAEGAAAKYGGWHVEIPDADAAFAREQKADSRVAGVTVFDNIGYASLTGGQNPAKPYLFIAGFHADTAQTLPVVLLSGRMPENSSEILVPAHVAANGGVRISAGDTLTLTTGVRRAGEETLGQHDPYRYGEETLVPAETKTYTVVGICQRPAFEDSAAPGYTLITASDVSGAAERLSTFITLKNPFGIRGYTKDLSAAGYSYVRNDEVLRFLGLSDDRVFTTLLYAVGAIVIAIIMLGSVFLIYNSFHISLNERMRQFGILASVGASARQLRHSVLFEGLCIGAAGIPVGILAGIGGIGLVISAVARNFSNILYSGVPLTLRVSVPAVLTAAAVSLITIFISAYIPAKKAAAVPVMECIRQTNEIKLEAKAVKTSRLAQRICGLEGTLALKNFKRNKKRCRGIVFSLVLSVALFITVNSFVIYLQQVSRQAAVFTTYDVGVTAEQMGDGGIQALYGQLKTVPGVRSGSYQTLADFSCTAEWDQLSAAFRQENPSLPPGEPVRLSVQIQFLDDSTFRQILDILGLPAEEYTGPYAKLLACAKMENGGAAQDLEEMADLFADSGLELTVMPQPSGDFRTEQGQNVDITFADFVPPDTLPVITKPEEKNYFFQAVAPYSMKSSFLTPDTPITAQGLTFRADTPAQAAAEMEKILLAEGLSPGCTVYNVSKMLEESRNYIFIANVFSYTFIILISLIAAANVFNTISTNIRLRRRELAMLRSAGMADRAFNRMMRFECAFYGMWALLVGLPLSVICSWMVYKGMAAGGAENITFVLPWDAIGVSTGSVLLVIFVTMQYAVRKIKKENIIDALRDDLA